jgi:hypothetical protein
MVMKQWYRELFWGREALLCLFSLNIALWINIVIGHTITNIGLAVFLIIDLALFLLLKFISKKMGKG